MPRSSAGGVTVRRLTRVALVWGALCAAPARADVVYELAPSVAAGVTDNARVSAAGEQRASSSFSIVGGSARLRYNGARSEHALGYRGTYTRYLEENGTTTFAHVVALTSALHPSARWNLDLTASGALSRVSGLDPNDPSVVFQQAAATGSTQYLSTVALQRLTYQPKAGQDYQQGLSVAQLRYLESTVNGVARNLPTTTVVTLALSGSRLVGRETFLLNSTMSDSIIVADGPDRGPFAQGHVFLGRVLAGWRHDLSVEWSTMLQAGPSVIFKLDGNGVLAPAFVATLNYTRLPWYASLVASQTPAPNLYLGAATLSDAVLARLAVPLTRNERLFVGGYGGYVYARVADANQSTTRVYDQLMGSVSLILRLSTARVVMAATYTVMSQRGSDVPGYGVPDLARQFVLLSIRCDLAWGAGTPPLFGGAL